MKRAGSARASDVAPEKARHFRFQRFEIARTLRRRRLDRRGRRLRRRRAARSAAAARRRARRGRTGVARGPRRRGDDDRRRQRRARMSGRGALARREPRRAKSRLASPFAGARRLESVGAGARARRAPTPKRSSGVIVGASKRGAMRGGCGGGAGSAAGGASTAAAGAAPSAWTGAIGSALAAAASPFARRRRNGGADDLRFDQDVVGPADHDQMFDIVAAQQNQLTLPVERKGVDQPQPRLARATAAGNAQAMAEREPINDREDQRDRRPIDRRTRAICQSDDKLLIHMRISRPRRPARPPSDSRSLSPMATKRVSTDRAASRE